MEKAKPTRVREHDPAREMKILVANRGIEGTADLLMEQQEDLEFQRALIKRLEETIANSQNATALQDLQLENHRLRELLAGGSIVVGVHPELPSEGE